MQTIPERIFLCGFMGVGKTTVGQLLADKLAYRFHDLDRFIEQQANQEIPAIFEAEGEQGFRSHERRALLTVIREHTGVISLGGGTLHNQYMVDHIKVNGLLAWLKLPISAIINRISGDENRPLLVDENGTAKASQQLTDDLTELYKSREHLYSQAEITLNSTAKATPQDRAAKLLKKIRYHVAQY